MPYLRRLVLLLTISTSILLVTTHLLHFFRPRSTSTEPLLPPITKEEAEKSFDYLKTYDHPLEPQIGIPNAESAANIAYGHIKPVPPVKDDVYLKPEDLAKILNPTTTLPKIVQPSKVAPPTGNDGELTPEDIAKILHSTSPTLPPARPAKVAPPVKDDSRQKFNKAKLVRPTLSDSKIAPPNATAWHKEKNMWKVGEALQGLPE